MTVRGVAGASITRRSRLISYGIVVPLSVADIVMTGVLSLASGRRAVCDETIIDERGQQRRQRGV